MEFNRKHVARYCGMGCCTDLDDGEDHDEWAIPGVCGPCAEREELAQAEDREEGRYGEGA